MLVMVAMLVVLAVCGHRGTGAERGHEEHREKSENDEFPHSIPPKWPANRIFITIRYERIAGKYIVRLLGVALDCGEKLRTPTPALPLSTGRGGRGQVRHKWELHPGFCLKMSS
jgi:hypothetical protein